MSESIQLLPPPSPGWGWITREISINGQIFYAMLQERQPEPPVWWETAYTEADYGHLLWLLGNGSAENPGCLEGEEGLKFIEAQIAHDVGVYRLCFDVLSVRIEERRDANGKWWATVIVQSDGKEDLQQEIVSKKTTVLQVPIE